MDGKRREQFDMIDTFIADHCLALHVAGDSEGIAQATHFLDLARKGE